MRYTKHRRLLIRNRRILARWYDGYSITELSRRFGLTPVQIRRILSEIDPHFGEKIPKQLVKRQRKKWLTDEKKTKITNLLGPTPKPCELSQNYGISRVLATSVAVLLRYEHKKILKSKKTGTIDQYKNRVDKAKRMFEAGASKRFLSQRFGFSRLDLSTILGDRQEVNSR